MSAAAAGLAVLVAAVGIQLAGPGAAEPDPTATPGGTSQATSPTPSVPATSPTASGYLVAGDELRRRAELARDGQEPYRAAVDQLVAAAEQALDDEPRPHNPITYRRGRFLQDARNAYTLALASVVTGDRTYAGHALTIIDAWVERTDSTRHACTTNGGSECATSLLVSRHAPAIVFAADLLESTGALSFECRERLQRWLADVILPAASQRTNNWGDAGTFMRIVVADYVGDARAFADAVDDWRASMDLVTAEGEIPEESRRGKLGLLYTQGAISYKAASAAVAERRGIDLWSYRGALGGSLRGAADAFARFWREPEAWPWHDRRVDIPTVDPAWEIIYQRWPDADYAAIFESHRPLGSLNPSAIIWTTLTNGEPIEPEPTGRAAAGRVGEEEGGPHHTQPHPWGHLP